MKNNLYCYKITWDTESAPNPHEGVLTLAICKPTIRRCSQIGDWISGWTAKAVHGKGGQVYSFDEQKLIYLAKITKKLTFEEYWNQYPQKRPKELYKNGEERKKSCGSSTTNIAKNYNSGDNIYKPLTSHPLNCNEYEQVANNNHGDGDKEHDLKGKYVLICEEFYYYGVGHAKDVDSNVFREIVPRCKKIPLDNCYLLIDMIQSDQQVTIKGIL